MKTKKTKAELYVQHKQEGKGTREAARLAGFKHGVPSQQARELLERVKLVEAAPQICVAAVEQVRKAKVNLSQGRQWLQAAKVAGVATN